MKNTIIPEEKTLLQILAAVMNGKTLPDHMNADWDAVLNEANKHGVISLLFDILQKQDLHPGQQAKLYSETKRMVMRNYHLYFLTRYLLNKFAEANIPVVAIKGISIAYAYPVPEYRKSGDVDLLLLDESRLGDSLKLLADINMIPDTSTAVHNVSWRTPDNVELEFHTMMIEPGKREDFNECYKEQVRSLNGQYFLRNFWGSDFPVLPDGYQAYELLLHMLHHFIREGFGLKLLCDWIAFWNKPVAKEDIEQYLSLVHEIHLENFSRMISSVCYHYLGMNGNPEGIYPENGKYIYAGGEFCEILTEDQSRIFLTDLLDGGEFGKSNKSRLVTMKASGLKGYVSEFHYAMRRKFPRGSKCFLTWPALWVATLVIFIRENRQNERNGIDVIKKSSERSQMIEELELFK